MATSVKSLTPVGYDELFQTKNITQTADKNYKCLKKKMLFFYCNFYFSLMTFLSVCAHIKNKSFLTYNAKNEISFFAWIAWQI